jgi:hypothetical protein
MPSLCLPFKRALLQTTHTKPAATNTQTEQKDEKLVEKEGKERAQRQETGFLQMPQKSRRRIATLELKVGHRSFQDL